MSSAFFCIACEKTYSTHSALRLHVKEKHPDRLDEIAPNKVRHCCETCSEVFKNIREFNRHKKIHTSALHCPLCPFHNVKSTLIEHFAEMHNVQMKNETLQFQTLDEFNTWKLQLEEKETVLFTNIHGSKTTKTSTKTVYTCHRSGKYVSEGKGIRHLKIQGSKKINAYCPAEIKLIHKDNIYNVKYVSTHIGHKNELCYIKNLKKEKIMLEGKIAAKIPIEELPYERIDAIQNPKLERSHLLTKQDLCNIKTIFSLDQTRILDTNDAVHVEIWITELKENGCIPFYKRQHEINREFSFLKEEDFVLVIMNEGQLEMLLSYGSESICVDGTNFLNGLGFDLHTLFVLNSAKEGFPCAFLISNRSDEQVFTLFFSCIRDRCAQKLGPRVFMSDILDSYYNAWVTVMNPPESRLYCIWRIDQDMKSQRIKIKNLEKRRFISDQFRALQLQMNREEFDVMLKKFIASLSGDAVTTQFGKHFETHYCRSVATWAHCYSLNVDINTNVHLKRMYSTIRYLHYYCKHTKRLDLCINAIMNYVKDNLFNVTEVLNEGKITSKINTLKSGHATSEKMDLSLVLLNESGCFNVCSDLNEKYHVKDNKSVCSCKLYCAKCEVCIHRYSCTCIDYTIQWNMCKHIHLVHRYKKNRQSQEPVDVVVENDVVCNDITSPIKETIEPVTKNVEGKTIDSRILELKNLFEKTISKIDTQEMCDAASQSVSSLIVTLNSLKSPKKQIMSEPSNSKKRKLSTSLEGKQDIIALALELTDMSSETGT